MCCGFSIITRVLATRVRYVCPACALRVPYACPTRVLSVLCTGPVCADGITRSAKNHWQLVLRLNDQQGHREKVVMDCRAGVLSPRVGQVDRGFATALGRRACRLAGEPV